MLARNLWAIGYNEKLVHGTKNAVRITGIVVTGGVGMVFTLSGGAGAAATFGVLSTEGAHCFTSANDFSFGGLALANAGGCIATAYRLAGIKTASTIKTFGAYTASAVCGVTGYIFARSGVEGIREGVKIMSDAIDGCASSAPQTTAHMAWTVAICLTGGIASMMTASHLWDKPSLPAARPAQQKDKNPALAG